MLLACLMDVNEQTLQRTPFHCPACKIWLPSVSVLRFYHRYYRLTFTVQNGGQSVSFVTDCLLQFPHLVIGNNFP